MTLGICSRGPENNSMEMCRREWDAARKLGLAHLDPCRHRAREECKERQAIKELDKAGLLGPDVILVHDTNTIDDESSVLAKTRPRSASAPSPKCAPASAFRRSAELMKAGVPLSLSVDTTVLAGNCDMFAIMKAIHNVANGEAKSEFAMPSRWALELATMGGARALGIADRVGSLTPGKRADIILVRTTRCEHGAADRAGAHDRAIGQSVECRYGDDRWPRPETRRQARRDRCRPHRARGERHRGARSRRGGAGQPELAGIDDPVAATTGRFCRVSSALAGAVHSFGQSRQYYFGRTTDVTPIAVSTLAGGKTITFMVPKTYLDFSPNWEGGLHDVISMSLIYPSMVPSAQTRKNMSDPDFLSIALHS